MVCQNIRNYQASSGLLLLISFVVLVLTPPVAVMGSPLSPLPQGNIWLTLRKAFLVLALPPVTFTWPVNQPKPNVWITLANLTGQDTLCLATASPEKPFSTCLVGLPFRYMATSPFGSYPSF